MRLDRELEKEGLPALLLLIHAEQHIVRAGCHNRRKEAPPTINPRACASSEVT